MDMEKNAVCRAIDYTGRNVIVTGGASGAGVGIALDAVFGENCNHILALDAKLLCQLVDTVLLILCHASFTLLRGCAKILSFYQMLSNAGISGGLIL